MTTTAYRPPLTSFPVYQAIRGCSSCRLRRNCVAPVPGVGSTSSGVMVVGESPGEREDETGIPFTGQTGRLLDYLLRTAGTSREMVYLTNIVKCPSFSDAPQQIINTCSALWLDGLEMQVVQPRILVAMGQAAIRHILSDLTLTVEHTHGIPHFLDGPRGPKSVTVLPTYNPAAGLRNTAQLRQIWDDWDVLGRILEGQDPMDFVPLDQYPDPKYVTIEREQDAKEVLNLPEYALDTETIPVGLGDGGGRALIGASAVGIGSDPSGRAHRLWSVQISNRAGTAYFIPAELVPDPATAIPSTSTVYVHNYLYDRQFITIPTYIDTMVAAYLLGLPQGLKQLSYRTAGMEMHSYEEYVYGGEDGVRMAKDYLLQVLEWEDRWPAPEPLVDDKWSDKEGMLTRVTRKPQSIPRKVRRMLNDHDDDPNTNLTQRWRNIDSRERKYVEMLLGAMPEPSLADVDPEAAVYYSSRDADATWRVQEVLMRAVKSAGLERVLFSIDLPVLEQLSEMMDYGMMVDREHLAGLSAEYLGRLQTAALVCKHTSGFGSFNPNSSAQVGELLYSRLRLGYPITQWTPTGNPYRDPNLDIGYLNTQSERSQVMFKEGQEPEKSDRKPARPSTDDQELKKVDHPVVASILEYRGLLKNKTTYVDPLAAKADSNSRVHATIRATRTETGRLSTSDPNLMAIPVRSAEGKRIREAFIAPPGYLLVAPDQSQIEMRVVAHLSRAPYLINAFLQGLDFHTATASRMFGVDYETAMDTKYRYPAKSLNFGIVYGMTPMGVYEYMLENAPSQGWTLEDCAGLLKAYDDAFPEVNIWRQQQIEFGIRNGYVQDLFGRRRYIPELTCPIQRIRSEGERMAGNMPVQSGAQGIIKSAGNRLWWLRKSGLAPVDFKFLLQVHDEIIFEVKEGDVPAFAPWCRETMESVVELSVPVVVEVKAGNSWGNLAPMEV